MVSAGTDRKIPIALQGKPGYRYVSDIGKGRGVGAKPVHKFGESTSFYFDKNAFARIRYVAGKPQARGKLIHRGPESNTLHNTFDYDLSPFNH
jgi:hypothetical protein